ALLLPVLGRAQERARRAACANNLKNIGVAFHAWAHEHNDLFPMQVSTNQGGTREFAAAAASNPNSSFTFRHFQAISNDLVLATMLRCPADKSRREAGDFPSLSNSNISYWINPAAAFGRTDSPVSGDRNVRTSGRIEWTFVQFSPDDSVEFTAELHGSRGNVLFGDGHVDAFDSVALRRAFSSVSNTANVILNLPREESAATPEQGTDTSSADGASSAGPTSGPSPGNNAARTATESGSAPDSPTEPKPNSPGSTRSGARDQGEPRPMLVTLLNGTVVTSSVPRTATNLPSPIQVNPSQEKASGNPLVEFARWLARTATEHTYGLLLLLLGAMIAFELARRRAQRQRRAGRQ
ncbi:MAG TPA: DUF1559 domain-containing protein, partial [Methylomirabilota bacterium]|nr:DUF1559 domain-containing protein [Methylomirabilota bacterium]